MKTPKAEAEAPVQRIKHCDKRTPQAQFTSCDPHLLEFKTIVPPRMTRGWPSMVFSAAILAASSYVVPPIINTITVETRVAGISAPAKGYKLLLNFPFTSCCGCHAHQM